jgi:hypothetical protein
MRMLLTHHYAVTEDLSAKSRPIQHFPQADFWPAIISGLRVILPERPYSCVIISKPLAITKELLPPMRFRNGHPELRCNRHREPLDSYHHLHSYGRD